LSPKWRFIGGAGLSIGHSKIVSMHGPKWLVKSLGMAHISRLENLGKEPALNAGMPGFFTFLG